MVLWSEKQSSLFVRSAMNFFFLVLSAAARQNEQKKRILIIANNNVLFITSIIIRCVDITNAIYKILSADLHNNNKKKQNGLRDRDHGGTSCKISSSPQSNIIIAKNHK